MISHGPLTVPEDIFEKKNMKAETFFCLIMNFSNRLLGGENWRRVAGAMWM